MSGLVPHDRRDVDNILMASAISMAATFATNLWYHFGARVRRFARLAWPLPEGSSKEQRRTWALEMFKVTADLCAAESAEKESDPRYHAWVDEWRVRLRLRDLPHSSLERNAKEQPAKFLYASCVVNEFFEAHGQRSFACWPIRRHFRPGFINVDTKAIGALLSLDASYERTKARENAQRKGAAERRALWRTSVGHPVIPRPTTQQRRAVARGWMTIEGEETAVRRLQAAWRAHQEPKHRWLLAQGVRHPNAVGRLKMLARAARRRARDARATEERRRDEHKSDRWAEVLTFGAALKIPKTMRFAGSLRTDGVSVRLLFKPDGESRRPAKRRRDDTKGDAALVPTTGLYAIDQLKHLSRQRRVEVIGADPGKRELLVCTNVSAEVPADELLRRVPAARLTAGERRHALRAERNTRCTLDFSSLSNHNSKSVALSTLQAYFEARRAVADAAFAAYESPMYRKRRWQAHRASQRCMTDFVRRIRALQRHEGSTLVLAYGSWSSVAGRPGQCCNRGNAPCIGIGLRRELSKHFVVAVTPEHHTSKTCCLCGHECGPCDDVDAQRRQDKIARATSDEELRRASRFSVRGLRRCTNAACAAHLNRDLNASVNIGRRCADALQGVAIDANEDEFERLRLSLNVI
jgi:hypothetical protein